MTENTATAVQCCNDECATEATPAAKSFAPRVDIIENESALFLYADLPGVRPQDVDLHYEHGELTLTGKIQPRETNGRPVFSEFDVGDFHRVFQVHETIDATKIDAEFKNGVLIVRLPKQEAVKPKQVPIRVQA